MNISWSNDELKRLAALYRYQILDTLPEAAFDDLTYLAASICQTPIALVSLVDYDRQWFKSKVGLTASETPRSIAFCHHAILSDQLLVVPDAQLDPRFTHNPLVTEDPKIRFYAGAPLITPEGDRLGTLCVIDLCPRELRPEQLTALECLSRQVISQLELRLSLREHQETEQYLRAMIDAEPECVKLLSKDGKLLDINASGLAMLEADCADTAIGTDFDALVSPPYRAAFQELSQRVLQGEKGKIELEMIGLQGTHRWLETHVVPLRKPYSLARTAQSLLHQQEIESILCISRDITERKQAEVAFQNLVEGAATISGENFFTNLVQYIAEILQVRYVMVATQTDRTLQSTAFWLDGQIQSNVTYCIENTPCNLAITLGEYVCLSGVQQHFSTNQALKALNAESYIGISLKNTQGEIIGCLYIVDNKPITQAQIPIAMLRVFAARASTELERQAAINALKQANEALEERITQRTTELVQSEEKFRQIFEQSPVGIAISDLEGHFISVNSSLLEIVGYAESDLLQRSIQEVFSESSHPPQDIHETQSLREPLVPVMDFEAQLISERGEKIWVNVTNAFIFNTSGSPSSIIYLFEDVTERKQTEKALQRQLSVIEAAIDGIAILEGDSHTYVNQSYLNLFGYQHPEELLGKSWKDLYSSQELDRFERDIFPTLMEHHAWQGEAIATCKDGSTFDEGLSITLTESGALICVCRDITAQKQAEAEIHQINDQLLLTNAELAQATRLKDEFLANMSHELRTPLNAILGMAEALQEEIFGEVNQAQRQAFDTIDQSGRHLLELINDILDLSKIESGKLELQVTRVSVKELCETCLRFVRQIAIKKNIRLIAEVPTDLPDISVDERRIRQVLINLLNNAIKFTPENGSVQFTVSLEVQETNYSLIFQIRDTGIGIAAEDFSKLFQPFVQIDSSITRKHAGTGLGLSLVKKLTQLHEGTISVSSEIDKGSCFSVRIPYTSYLKSLEVTASKVTPQPTEALASDANRTILVIEDVTAISEQITRYLSEVNLQTVNCSRGQGALETALQVQPALILLDILLPDISGWDVLNQLKSHPQTQQIPVVMISVVDERSRGLSCGASEYLVKPINRQQLYSVLTSLQIPITRSSFIPAFKKPTVTHPLVLIADDNPANISTLSSYLKHRDFKILLASNGIEAITSAESHHPDLIVMDIQMPEMDGLSAIHQIRANPETARIPIVALTAFAMPGDREKCIEAGANEYISKPVKLKSLFETIQQLLN